jgi:hypothetical protein
MAGLPVVALVELKMRKSPQKSCLNVSGTIKMREDPAKSLPPLSPDN